MDRALLIVDVQPTFCEGGALGVDGGNAVAERIADFVTENADEYSMIVTTQDWHVDPGKHFSDKPDYVDTWPPHGVAGTEEAELHEAIASLPIDESVKKGAYSAAYSGFEGVNADGEPLEQILRRAEIGEVDVVGIAESHCVKATALDALRAGWRVRVLSDLTVPTSEEQGKQARVEMDEAGVEQIDSSEAFGFYEEEEDTPIPGDDPRANGGHSVASGASWGNPADWAAEDWNDFESGDYDGDGVPDDLEDDEYGAADYEDDELPPRREDPIGGDAYNEESDAELTSDGEEEELDTLANRVELDEDISDYDLSDFNLDEDSDDFDLDDPDGLPDFSDDADEGDFDFSDIDYRPQL